MTDKAIDDLLEALEGAGDGRRPPMPDWLSERAAVLWRVIRNKDETTCQIVEIYEALLQEGGCALFGSEAWHYDDGSMLSRDLVAFIRCARKENAKLKNEVGRLNVEMHELREKIAGFYYPAVQLDLFEAMKQEKT